MDAEVVLMGSLRMQEGKLNFLATMIKNVKNMQRYDMKCRLI